MVLPERNSLFIFVLHPILVFERVGIVGEPMRRGKYEHNQEEEKEK